MSFKRLIFDIETNGLLKEQGAVGVFAMDKIHCIVIMDIDTGEIVDYVNTPEENDLEEGVRLLMQADLLAGHNIIDFDIPAIQFVYPWFEPSARIVDTLVMSRMCFADVKEKDFRMAAKGNLEGRLIGLQGLEAWGQRLGKHKGDYKKEREADLKARHKEAGLEPPTAEELHVHVWGQWNEPMHDYCVNDVEVNKELWDMIESMRWSEQAISIEHNIHALMVQQERNGFYFDLPRAEVLAQQLQTEYDRFYEEAVDAIGMWFRPVRWHNDDMLEPEHGETEARRTWGNVTVPKNSMNRVKSIRKYAENREYKKVNGSVEAGCPFVKVELREFNPNSRQQIVDRLSYMYGWTPQDFTEKGNPRVDDEILRNLIGHIPLAETLAEIFYYKKRIGMVADGKNGWLKLVRDDQRIHGRVNVGGTVSGRATHAAPNVSQVPGVNPLEPKDYDKGVALVERHKKAGTLVDSKWNEKKGEWKIIVRGREGDHGWDCRELFTVPKGYSLMGCDLSGIEFRCLANLTYAFDGGELVDVVLNGDIHQKNADLAGISRGVAKRLLYACVDMETQALTKEGWKYYHELREGELALTYNMEKDIQEWQPIQKLHFVEGAERVRIEGRGLDVVCTPDHRWATMRRHMVDGSYVWSREFCRTDELTPNHKIIANAPFVGDALGDCGDLVAPKYREDLAAHVLVLSHSNRRPWLHGFLTADGHQRSRHPEKLGFTQKSGVTFEAALAAQYIESDGRLTTHMMSGSGNLCWKTEVCDSRTWSCQKIEIEKIDDGDVWCMTTENSSFVMRRGNFVTITGNCMYGGGDSKLGSIVEPLASEARQRSVGKTLRAKLMAAMPSLKEAIKQIHKEMRLNGGSIMGLDGRRLFARSKHSALNLRLQSDGALIAKKWCLLIDDMLYEKGWDHHVDGDYAFCSWSHDEVQLSVRNELAQEAARIAEAAAPLTGEYFDFKCPVAAEAKIGLNWAQTH